LDVFEQGHDVIQRIVSFLFIIGEQQEWNDSPYQTRD